MKAKDHTYGLTVDRVRHLLAYDPVDGVLRWKPVDDLPPGVRAGVVAGCVEGGKYVRVWVDGHRYVAHRLVWFHVFGEWPKDQIDHRDGNKANNRIDNLREATNSQNKANGSYRNSSLGLKGIRKNGKNWGAQIRKDGKTLYLGTFSTPEEAHAAYMRAAEQLHGDFANSGLH